MVDKKREAVEWIERGEQFYQKGRLQEAEECYRTSIDLDKKNAIAWAMYGTILKDQGKLDESLKAFKHYFKLDKPPHPAVQLNYASLLKMRQEFKEAEKTYKLVVKAMPDFALAWYNFGNLYLDQSMWLDAVHKYDKALRCDLDNHLRSKCLLNKGAALKERGELRDAEAALREAFNLDPSNEDIKMLLEQTSQLQEREHQVESTLRGIKIARTGPDGAKESVSFSEDVIEHAKRGVQDLLSQIDEGFRFCREEQYDEAEMIAKEVLRKYPDNPSALLLMADVLIGQGKYDDSLSITERVLNDKPRNALAWVTRAEALTRQGHIKEAETAIKNAMSWNPNNKQLEDYYRRWKMRV